MSLPPSPPPPLPPLSPAAIDYATTHSIRRGPNSVLYWLAFSGWIIAAGGGVLCFFGYLLSSSVSWAIFGLVWLYVGGFITFIALVLGIIYAALALASGFTYPASRRRAILAFVLPLTNVVLAIALAFVGIKLMESRGSGLFSPVFNPPTTGPTSMPTSMPIFSPTSQPADVAQPDQ